MGASNGTFPSELGETEEADNASSGTDCQGYSTSGGNLGTPSGNNNNCYSLQMNTNIWAFTSTPFTGTATASEFPGGMWQQFVFVSDPACNTLLGCDPFGHPSEWLYIQYVLINFSPGATNGCTGVPNMDGISWNPGPSGQPGVCYGASPDLSIPDAFGSAPLSQLELNATATPGGDDTLQLCGTPSSGLGCSGVLSEPDDVMDLADFWDSSEFNVFGAAGGSEAIFNTGTTLTVHTELFDQLGNPIAATCLHQSHTGETNSLALGPCTDGPGITFTESNFVYSVSASPSDLTVLRGQTATYSVAVLLAAGTGQPINLSVDSPLPSGASASFSTNPVTPNGTSTLTITTSLTGALGDFPLLISGEFGGGPPSQDLYENVTVNLHIYDFNVVISPSDQTVVRGGAPAVYALTLVLVPGSTTVGLPAVQLTVTPSPFDALFVLSALSATPTSAGCTSLTLEDCLAITVTTNGPPSGSLGDFTFLVTGTDPTASGGARTGTANLHIFDFTVNLSPAAESLPQGASTTMVVSVGLVPGSTSFDLPSVSLALTGVPSGVVAVGFPSSLSIGGSQAFTLETSTVGEYVSCPHVSPHGGQNLRNADLAHCNLAGYDLRGDDLRYANLSGADLQNANLAWDDLDGANLASANTSGTNFQGDDMRGVDLTAAGPMGVFVLKAIGTTDGASRSGSSTLTVLGDQLSGDCFLGDDLTNANLTNDVAVRTNFGLDNLLGVDLAGADLLDANFGWDNLLFADLAGVNAQGANFGWDNLAFADLAGADLQGANFQGANLARADLEGTLLTGLGPSFGQLTNFNWANLQGANLTGAICGSPNYITAWGANTRGVVGVPAACNPPLDPAPGFGHAKSPVSFLHAILGGRTELASPPGARTALSEPTARLGTVPTSGASLFLALGTLGRVLALVGGATAGAVLAARRVSVGRRAGP